ncbi:MAG: sporulation protein Cse60 [Bacilli bacterium]|nr:sporulation protein Cse60 [Bacilli bacterium]MDD4643772.1 sporulation protein Cse60 [Bacilli bacterium]
MMKVKIFDENHEKDLEKEVNDFLATLDGEVIDMKYQVSVSVFAEEQIYCFSVMIIYQ